MISNQKNIYAGQRSVRTLPYLQFSNAKWIVSELVANMPPGLRRHMLDERLRVQNLTKIFDYSLPQIRPEAIEAAKQSAIQVQDILRPIVFPHFLAFSPLSGQQGVQHIPFIVLGQQIAVGK